MRLSGEGHDPSACANAAPGAPGAPGGSPVRARGHPTVSDLLTTFPAIFTVVIGGCASSLLILAYAPILALPHLAASRSWARVPWAGSPADDHLLWILEAAALAAQLVAWPLAAQGLAWQAREEEEEGGDVPGDDDGEALAKLLDQPFVEDPSQLASPRIGAAHGASAASEKPPDLGKIRTYRRLSMEI